MKKSFILNATTLFIIEYTLLSKFSKDEINQYSSKLKPIHGDDYLQVESFKKSNEKLITTEGKKEEFYDFNLVGIIFVHAITKENIQHVFKLDSNEYLMIQTSIEEIKIDVQSTIQTLHEAYEDYYC